MKYPGYFSVVVIALLCACSQQSISSSTSALATLNQQYLGAKADWIRADVETELTICPVAKSANRAEYTTALKKWQRVANASPTDENVAHQNEAQQRLADLDDRLKACNSIEDAGAPVKDALAMSASDPTGAKWDEAQHAATRAVLASIDLVNRLPSASIRGMSYSDSTQQTLRERREKIIAAIGEMMPHAVEAAKAASGDVLSQTSSATHELDKQFAENSDHAYSYAATGLAALPNVAGPGAFMEAADGVIGNSGLAVRSAAHQAGSGSLSMDERVGNIVTATFAPLATPGRLPTAKEESAAVSGSLATPVDAVKLYYVFWGRQQYREMYGLLSSGYQANHPFSSWLQSHNTTTSITASATQGSSPGNVRVEIEANDGDYAGTWHLVNVAGAWKLDSNDISKSN